MHRCSWRTTEGCPDCIQQPSAAKAWEAAAPGRIDNNPLMPPVMRVLNDGLVEGVDFVAVSEKSWDRLRSWCGHICPALPI